MSKNEADEFNSEIDSEDLAPSDVNEEDLVDITRETISKTVLHPTDWTVGVLVDMLRRKKIDLAPHFQRRVAWDETKMSRFIESLFLRLPVPQIVLAEIRPGRYTVIDGKQRLTSLARYCLESDDNQPLILSGCEYIKEINRKTFFQLSAELQHEADIDAFESTTIRTIVISNFASMDILYLMFLRLNQNSVTLSPQELRNALYPGEFSVWIDDWTSNSDGLTHIFSQVPDFRMRDIEVTLRHLAFRLYPEVYSGNMKAFLDNTSDKLMKNWGGLKRQVEGIAENFDASLQCADKIFGRDAFRVFQDGHYTRAPNRAVIDVLTYYFSIPEIRDHAIDRAVDVKSAYEALCGGDAEFRRFVQSSTKTNEATAGRFEKWRVALEGALGLPIPEVPIPKKKKR
tara:strand:- start:3715 stop:4914 length:1200 start_codon:yes stop_codon:yes gene_type:complete